MGFYKPLVVVESSCMITISASGQGKATSFHQFTVSWTFIILSCLLLEAIFILFCCFLESLCHSFTSRNSKALEEKRFDTVWINHNCFFHARIFLRLDHLKEVNRIMDFLGDY